MKKIILAFTVCVLSTGAMAIEPCDTIYTQGLLLGEGVSKLVYEAGKQQVDGRCFATDCAPTVVKERRFSAKTLAEQAEITKKAIEWNLAPPVYLTGECVRDKKTISFEIERLCKTLTPELLSKRPEYFAGKIQRRLDRLHKENIIHGDPHIGNILIDASDQLFLSDFDTSFFVKDPAEKQGRSAFENFLASQIWSPTSTWQLFAHKYKQFDVNRDGKINQKELDNLSDAVGQWDNALVISKIYAEQTSLLSSEQKIGFFLDIYNNGVAHREEMAKLGIKEDQVVAYEAFAKRLKERMLTYRPKEKGMRVVSKQGPYDKLPLLASQILIISGGDVNEKRMFPLYTRRNFHMLAENQGYKFQHDTGNRASPYMGYWHKIFMLIDKLSDVDNRVIVWLDDDGVVDEKSRLVEALLEAHPNQDVIVARDPQKEAAYVNSGFLIIRNTLDSLALLQRIIEVGHEGRCHRDESPLWFQENHLLSCKQDFNCLHEQQALQELLTKTRHVCPNHMLKRNERDWASKVAVIPQIGSVESEGGTKNLWDALTGKPPRRDYQINVLLKDGATSTLEGLTDTEVLQNLDPPAFGQRVQEGAPLPFFVQCASQGKDKSECVNNLLLIKSEGYLKIFESLPNGPYKKDCSYCSNEGAYFQCQCPDSSQKWRLSRAATDCDGKIENRDGYLFCTKKDIPQCASSYSKSRQLEHARDHKIYHARFKTTENCLGETCSDIQVREYAHVSNVKDPYLASLIKASGAASQIYAEGHCLDGRAHIYFVAQESRAPITRTELERAPLFFEKKIYELLKRLQESQLAIAQIRPEALHFNENNDLVVSNIEDIQLMKPLTAAQGAEFLAKQLFIASSVLEGTSKWQSFFRAYQRFDYSRSGTIFGDGFEELVNLTGNLDRAHSIKTIYEHRYKHLKTQLPEHDFKNFIASREKFTSPVDYVGKKLCAVLNDLTAAFLGVKDPVFEKRYSGYEPKKDRIISSAGPYSDRPLFSSEILVISGGDITPQRSFPLYTRFNFLNFAKKRDYKFEHYSGNLAYPFLGYWHKIYMLIDRLADPSNRVVVWLDDDGVIDESSDMIEQYLNAFPEQDVIVARDPEDFAYVNSGVLIVRNADKSLALLADILTVGEEGSNRLMKCKQDFNCLHEQQALEMLLRRKTKSSREDWSRHVAVVPQVDTTSGRNMNFLLKNGPDYSFEAITQSGEKESYDRYVDFKKKYGAPPFFAQCSDARQDKNLCVRKVLEYYAPGFVEKSGHAPPNGPYLASCQCMNLGNKLECNCGHTVSSISLPCDLGSIEFHDGELVCIGRDNLPAGNYHDSCTNCYRTKSVFHCECRAEFGVRHSDVRIPCEDGKIIENMSGQLKCLFPKRAIPSGDYQNAFRECEQRGNVLRCTKDRDTTEIMVPCPLAQELEARDNKLVCLDKKKPLPKGYYRARDMGNCEYRRNVLQCRVDQLMTSLELPCPPDRVIDIVDGKLTCELLRNLAPTGTYLQTCSRCRIDNGSMECSCKDARGNSSKSLLELPCYDAENREGKLKCARQYE